MPTILSINPSRALDLNGYSVPGAQAFFFDSGTTSPRTVYSDQSGTVPHPSPLVANGAGVFPAVFDTEEGNAKVIVTDSDGVTLPGYPIDPAIRVSTDETGASSVSFSPTADIPVTTVQAAIEQVQANIVEPLADFGLGVTGNAVVLSDLDASNIASGFYRYDGTTVGTFPSGVTASDGGIVMVFRQSSGVLLMQVAPSNADRIHVRRYNGTWASWVHLLDSADTASSGIWADGTSSTAYAATPVGIRSAIDAEKRAWFDRTSQRAINAVYRNETGRTIQVVVLAQDCVCEVEGSTGGWVNVGTSAPSNWDSQSFSVPPGVQYRVRGPHPIQTWSEFR